MDTSALTKLLISEPETTELRTWLTAQSGQGEDAATSTLGRVELMRVVADTDNQAKLSVRVTYSTGSTSSRSPNR